jgi:hypothetical protein
MWVTGARAVQTALLIAPHLFPQVKLWLLETVIQSAVLPHTPKPPNRVTDRRLGSEPPRQEDKDSQE